MSDTVPEHCQYCDTEPVAGFNGVVFCDEHAIEGIGEVARVMAIAQGINDPQRIAAMADKLVAMYREADTAIDNDEMQVGDSITGNTGYNPSAN